MSNAQTYNRTVADPSLRITHYALRFTHRKGIEPLLATLFFVILTLAMTWPLATYLGESFRPAVGDVALQMTVLRWNAHALATNPLGLFEAPFFYPYAHSIAFSEHLLGETILALPILGFTGNPALAFNFNVLLSFVLTGLSTYLLVRDLTGSRTAGLFSGVAFAFCPFRFMQIEHLHILATQWFPFTLWTFGRVLGVGDWVLGTKDEGRRTKDGEVPLNAELKTQNSKLKTNMWLAWAVLGFIAMGLSSVYYTFFLAIAAALYVVWWIAFGLTADERRVVPWRSLALKLGVAALVVGAVLAPLFIPYAQTSSELGLSRTVYELQNWSAEWQWYGKVLPSNWLYGHLIAPGMAQTSGERELFFGLVPAVLALVGLVWGRGRGRFYYLLLGLFSLAMTFGVRRYIPGTDLEIPLPYAFFYNWLPGFQALRVPVRFAVLVDFSTYVLAGYGLARVLGVRGMSESGGRLGIRRGGRVVMPVVLTALVLAEFANPLDASDRRDVMVQLTSIEPYGWLAQPQNSGPLVELPMTADQPDVQYMLFGTRDWQPLVDGWSGFVPPGTVQLKRALDAFPDPTTVALLQGLEVRHVVVHLWQFPPNEQAGLKRRLDSTPQLEPVYHSGENYVYELARNPWLRRIGTTVGSGTLWVGESRHEAMPSLEVLAYALRRWGLKPEQIAGNIDIGYRPIGSLPFGRPADYALIPNAPDARDVPFGYEDMQPAESNPAVRLLKRDQTLVKSYDLTAPGAPKLNMGNVQMAAGASSVAFGGETAGGEGGGAGTRALDLSLVAFAPSEADIQVGDGQLERLSVPAGVSHYITLPFPVPAKISFARRSGDAKLLRVDLKTGETDKGLVASPDLMPLETSSAKGNGTLDSRLLVVAPRGGKDFTITVDTYVEPWGTHPQGHFGSWSVVLPADGAAHEYTFHLDPITKAFNTTRDGQPTQTFGWTGHPTQGDFKTSVSIRNGAGGLVANMPLYLFNRKENRLTGWQGEPAALSVVRP